MIARVLDKIINSIQNLLSAKNKKAGWVWVGYGEDPFKDER